MKDNERFTKFGHIRGYSMAEFRETCNAAKEKRWPDFIGHLIFNIVVIVFALSIVITAWGIVSSSMQLARHSIFGEEFEYSPKTLTYSRLKQEKTEDGLYRTLFKITIINPPNNTNLKATIIITGIFPDAECEQGSENHNVEYSPGSATSTRTFLWDCITKDRILDNGQLFSIIE